MVTLLLMLRVVPYAVVAVIAFRKGFRWLSLCGLSLVLIALFNFTQDPNMDLRAMMAAAFSFLLLIHALDLRSRRV